MPGHILIVDDDALMRRSLSFNLEQSGYRTSNAANAEDALALARRDPPDLVLLDIGLPGMDGLDALRHLKDESGVPVIFLTARRRELLFNAATLSENDLATAAAISLSAPASSTPARRE